MTENHILWEELGKLQQEWEKTTDGNTEINQMLEFSENDFVLFCFLNFLFLNVLFFIVMKRILKQAS